MGWVKDNLIDPITGRSATRAAEQQQAAFRDAQNLTREATEQARTDINRLFPVAQQNILTGAQGAMDVFNQVTPQQLQYMQQGNMAAQQALLAGLPQMNNAILGLPVDYSGIQARQFATPQFNFSMPNFNQNYGAPAATQQTQQQGMQTPQGQQQFVQNVLAGMFGGQGATSIMGGGGGAGNRNAGELPSLFGRVR